MAASIEVNTVNTPSTSRSTWQARGKLRILRVRDGDCGVGNYFFPVRSTWRSPCDGEGRSRKVFSGLPQSRQCCRQPLGLGGMRGMIGPGLLDRLGLGFFDEGGVGEAAFE